MEKCFISDCDLSLRMLVKILSKAEKLFSFLTVYIIFCTSLCFHMHVCLLFCLPVCLPACLSVCHPSCLSAFLSGCISVMPACFACLSCLSVLPACHACLCLPVSACVCLCLPVVCLCVRMLICLSV